MLAQNFKMAKDLSISDVQKDALIKTLVLLETGRLEYSKAFNFDYDEEPDSKFSGKFNMRYWTEHSECGTIACIGGTAELISGVEFRYAHHVGLRRLFQPSEVDMGEWADITPEQAARALRSYLTTGDARWDLALSPQETAHE